MSALVLAYSTALLLGSLHAFEADHMAAVTAFAVRRPGLRGATVFAVRWAVGHGGAIVLIGATLLLLGIRMPAATEHWLERAVGVVMIALGLWTWRTARTLHAHAHAHGHAGVHEHVHAHPRGIGHEHGSAQHGHTHHTHSHAVTAVGLVHGLAGSGAAVALIPMAAFDSPARGILFLVLFALGTILAMALYGLLAGAVVGRTASSSVRLARHLARATGLVTVAVGVVWLLR